MKKLLFLCLLHTVSLVYGMQNPSEQANTFLDQHNLSFRLGSIKNDAVALITVFDELGEPLKQIDDEKTVVFYREFTEFEQFERMAHGAVHFSTAPMSFLVDFNNSSISSSEDEQGDEEIFLQLICAVQNNVCRAEALLLKESGGGAMNILLRATQEIQLPLFCPHKAILDIVIDEFFDSSEFDWKIQQLEGQR